MAVRLISCLDVQPKMFESYFLDMIYVEFMKNFLLADSSKLIAVRLILKPAFSMMYRVQKF